MPPISKQGDVSLTAKITISMPDNLKRMIDEYNKRHPFEPLIISQLAQKAVFEKIKSEDPELLTTTSALHHVKEYPEVKAREIKLEEELARPSPEESQTSITKQHTLEVVCAECGETFTAERSTRRFCSGKCKTAYGRKHKK